MLQYEHDNVNEMSQFGIGLFNWRERDQLCCCSSTSIGSEVFIGKQRIDFIVENSVGKQAVAKPPTEAVAYTSQ
jgi:hypothetical protein